MASTVFINKVSTVWTAFLAHMQQLAGSGVSSTVRVVVEGETFLGSQPIPCLAVKFEVLKPGDRTDTSKQKMCTIKLKIATKITTSGNGTRELLDLIAKIDNKIEAFVKPDGVTGFENSEWGTTYFTDMATGDQVSAECTLSFGVMVARGQN